MPAALLLLLWKQLKHYEKVSEYDQEIPQSQIALQTNPLFREKEQQNAQKQDI